MEHTGWMGKTFSLCQWITRLAYINLLWIIFMLLGLFVFGAAPSTASMFSILRKWVQGESNFPIFTTFWETYKKEFRNANLLGLFLLVVSVILYIDWRLISSVHGILNPILTGCLIGVAFLFMVVMVFVFPVFVHYKFSNLQYIKTAFLIGISHPLYTMTMLLSVFFALFISFFFTGVGILFFGSGLGFALMYISNMVFSKMNQQMTGQKL
ncbi:YesL family protein [Neobacillus sp. NPDC058068]|uniref:YesL family protein n=1 Tax=Neobacillus sp. NPDC058068 TaxID=3346325 RepID=UPI0036DCA9A5